MAGLLAYLGRYHWLTFAALHADSTDFSVNGMGANA